MPAKGTLVTPVRQDPAGKEADRAASALTALGALSGDLTVVTEKEAAGALLTNTILATIEARRAVLMIEDLQVLADARREGNASDTGISMESITPPGLPFHLLHEVIETKKSASIYVDGPKPTTTRSYTLPDGLAEARCVPLVMAGELAGLLYVELEARPELELDFARQFIELAANQSAAVIGILSASHRMATNDRTIDDLRGEVDSLRDGSFRLARLARGGAWRWDTETRSMSESVELRSALGMSGERTTGVFNLWDWNVGCEDGIPADVVRAVAMREPFETTIQIVRPGDEIVTTLLVSGETCDPAGLRYEGFAFDIGPLVEKWGLCRRGETDDGDLDTVWANLANPLSCIMVDASAASRWLDRTVPNIPAADVSLRRIQSQVRRICEMLGMA